MFWIFPLALVGSFLEGEFTLMAICFILLAQGKTLPLIPLAVVAALGAFLGDWCCFELGRSRGERLVQRWPRIKTMLDAVGGFLNRAPVIALLILRFQIACRMAGNLSLGMGELQRSRYLVFNGVACCAWAATILPLCQFFAKLTRGLLSALGNG